MGILIDKKNISEFNNVVKTTGYQTIDGLKTFTTHIAVKSNSMDITASPTTSIFSDPILTRDKNNVDMGALQTWQHELYNSEEIVAINEKSDGSKIYSSISAVAFKNGTIVGYAPTTPLHCVGTEIVTANRAGFFSIPSARSDALTLGASGSTYTAPGDGYFYINKEGKSDSEFVTLEVDNLYGISARRGNSNIQFMVPSTRGRTLTVYYNASGKLNSFRFYYINGSNSTNI